MSITTVMMLGSLDQNSPPTPIHQACNLANNLAHLRRFGYPRFSAEIQGSLQVDEMLLLFSLVRASSILRILEIGGLNGRSAFNFLEALRCKRGGVVITVDVRPSVKRWGTHPVSHLTLIKNAADLTMDDIGRQEIDALLLDCHAYYSSQNVLRNVFERGLLSRHGFIFLHDTGLHRNRTYDRSQLNLDPSGYIHQPVERLLAQWIQTQDCSFQRISIHDDLRIFPRQGITIMQRRVNLDINDCNTGKIGKQYFDYEPRDCLNVQHAMTQENKRCPVAS